MQLGKCILARYSPSVLLATFLAACAAPDQRATPPTPELEAGIANAGGAERQVTQSTEEGHEIVGVTHGSPSSTTSREEQRLSSAAVSGTPFNAATGISILATTSNEVAANDTAAAAGEPATSANPQARIATDLDNLSDSAKSRVTQTLVAAARSQPVSTGDAESRSMSNTGVSQSSRNERSNPYYATERSAAENWAIQARYVDESLIFDRTNLSSGQEISTEVEPQPPDYLGRISLALGSAHWRGVERLVNSRGRRLYSILYSDIESNDDDDYMALGFWIRLPDFDDPFEVEVPSFTAAVSGNDPFDLANIEPLGGRAAYEGDATGLYASTEPDPTIAFFNADVFLTADFDHNRIWGVVTDGVDVATGEELFGGLGFEPARIQTGKVATAEIQNYKSAFFHDQVTGAVGAKYFEGSWGGQLFGNGESPTAIPGSVAGTFGASARDGSTTVNGVFGTYFRGHTRRMIRSLQHMPGLWKEEAYASLSRAAGREMPAPGEDEVLYYFADEDLLVVSSTEVDPDQRWNNGATQSSKNEFGIFSAEEFWTVDARFVDGSLVLERTDILEHENAAAALRAFVAERDALQAERDTLEAERHALEFELAVLAATSLAPDPAQEAHLLNQISVVEAQTVDLQHRLANVEFQLAQADEQLSEATVSTEEVPLAPGFRNSTSPIPGSPNWKGIEHHDIETYEGYMDEYVYSGFLSDISDDEDTDYLVLAYWLEVNAYSEDMEVYGVEFGAAASGSDAFDDENMATLTGTATYEGDAAGLHATREPNPVFRYFNADVVLTADFDDYEIWGVVHDGRDMASGEQVFSALAMEPARFRWTDHESGAHEYVTWFSDHVTAAVDDEYFDGYWGGHFFGNGDQVSDLPGSVAGTFGARAKGDVSESIVGVFGAYRQP